MTANRLRAARAMLLLTALTATLAATPAPAAPVAPSGPVPTSAGRVADKAPGVERVIVHSGDVDAFLRGLGRVSDFSLVYRYPFIRGAAVAVPSANVDRVIRFARSSGIKADRDMKTQADLTDSARTVHVKANGVNSGAWGLGYNGAGVTIAVLDSGIYAQHTSLDDVDDNPATTDPKVILFRDYVNAGGAEVAPYDDNDHGSHVAGIAAGTGGGTDNIGMAFRANLAGFKVFNGAGAGVSSDFIAALGWVVDNGEDVRPPIRVVNYSGGSRGVGGNNNGNSPQSLAVDAASDAGIVVVASGGNGSQDGNGPNTVPGNLSIPSDARKAISVCSSDSANPPTAPTYSDWDSEGPTGDGRIKPDVCAPGDGVRSVNSPAFSGVPCPPLLVCGGPSSYAVFGGTSMSSPHVAGIVALIMQAAPAITPDQVREVLFETAREYPSKNNDRGHGEVNARSAVQLAVARYGVAPPLSVSANGPYTVPAGETVTLTARALGGSPGYSYAWDLDNNGSFETPGRRITFSNTSFPAIKNVRVRATDSGATPQSATDSTVITILAKTTVLSDSVESGDNGWVSNDPAGWHRTTIRANSPTHSWYAGEDNLGQYRPLSDFTLTRTVDLSSVGSAQQVLLRFSRSGDLEENFDFLRAQIKRPAEATWTTLATYDDSLGSTWKRESLDITAYRGAPAQIRFQFTSDEFFELTGPFIDDIDVIGTSTPTVDTAVPAPIGNLAAGTPTETSLTLTWTATGDDGTVGTASAYDLRRSTSPITAGNFGAATPVSGVPAPKASGSAESFVAGGLTPGTTYHFAIKAIDEAGNTSAVSNSASGATLVDVLPPSAVTLSGVAGDGGVDLSWTEATDNGAIAGYRVLQDGVAKPLTTGLGMVVGGLNNGQTYEFRVQAVDTGGNDGPLSNLLRLTPLGPQAVSGWPEARRGGDRTGAATGRGSLTVPNLLHSFAMPGPVDASPVIADLDRDGDLDIIAASDPTATALATVRAFERTATGFTPMWTYEVPVFDFEGVEGQNGGSVNIAVGNLNLAGGLEVAVYSNTTAEAPSGNSLNQGRLAVLDGMTGALIDDLSTDLSGTEALVIGLDAPPAIADVTGDGVPEIVLIHHVGGTAPGSFLASFKLSGGVLVEQWDTNITTASNWRSWAVAELRSAHDGLEVIVGQSATFSNTPSSGAVRVCKPSATAANCDENVATTTGVMGLSVADLDGDSSPEIVANGRTGQSLNVIKTTPALSRVSLADGGLWNTASLADVDGDGRTDIVNVRASAPGGSAFPEWDTARTGHVSVRGFDGTAILEKGVLARTPPTGSDFGGKGGGVLADITGDSRPEFVFGSNDGNLVAIAITPAGVPSQLWTLPLAGAPVSPPAAMDVTGDGLLDLVGGTAAGTVYVVGAGAPARLRVTPSSATVQAGVAQAYVAETMDAAGNVLADVTSSTTFGIAPNGTCGGTSSCSATVAGMHTVTATRGTLSATATLDVVAGPLHHLAVSPANATIKAGETRSYTAQGFDQYDNSRGDVTAGTTFSISPNGGCSGTSCGSNVVGAHTVKAVNGSAMGTTGLTVEPAALDHLVLTPASSTVAVGVEQPYTATGRDRFGNSLGDVTATTVFTISPSGTCRTNRCTDNSPGNRTVSGRSGTAIGSASLRVVAAIDHVVLTPSMATMTAGGSQAYTAEGFDAGGNSVGDVTSTTVFTISPSGSCTGNVCTATHASDHVVTGNNRGATGTAILRVTAGPLASLTVTPGYTTMATGQSRTFLASGRDAFGNSLGDQTPAALFTIAPEGTCTRNSCTANVPGSHTVTARVGAITGTATLQVNPLAPVIVAPAEGSFTPPSVTVSGTAPVGSTVRLADNGVEIASNVTVDSSGNWTVTRTFAAGSHSLAARAFAAPSSLSDPSNTRTFVVDGSPPSVSITRPAGYTLFQPVVGGAVTVRGSAADQGIGVDRVELVYSEAFTDTEIRATLPCPGACGSFGWRDDRILSGGYWTVQAVAFDRAGNRSNTASINLFVMNAP